MVTLLRKMTEVFLDTSFAIALSATTDQSHARAVDLANQLEKNGTRLVTTQAILLEIGNALSKQLYRVAAVQLLESLVSDPHIEVVPLSNNLITSTTLLSAYLGIVLIKSGDSLTVCHSLSCKSEAFLRH
jgi:predicted nucleic acid-binding protein